MILNRIEFVVCEDDEVPDHVPSVYYKWEAMHDWRGDKAYDIFITRHDETRSFETHKNQTHMPRA